MRNSKKVELSPQLRLGVGRARSQNNILKFSVAICLVLALGLSINAVRLVMNGKSQPATQVLGATDTKNTDSSQNIQFIQYKVQKGDTLFNIAQKYNIDWATLGTLNNLQSPFLVKPGDIIKIPK